MYSRSTKEKAIYQTLIAWIVMCGGHNAQKIPGYVISRLPKEMRDILSECTSDDWNRIDAEKFLGLEKKE